MMFRPYPWLAPLLLIGMGLCLVTNVVLVDHYEKPWGTSPPDVFRGDDRRVIAVGLFGAMPGDLVTIPAWNGVNDFLSRDDLPKLKVDFYVAEFGDAQAIAAGDPGTATYFHASSDQDAWWLGVTLHRPSIPDSKPASLPNRSGPVILSLEGKNEISFAGPRELRAGLDLVWVLNRGTLTSQEFENATTKFFELTKPFDGTSLLDSDLLTNSRPLFFVGNGLALSTIHALDLALMVLGALTIGALLWQWKVRVRVEPTTTLEGLVDVAQQARRHFQALLNSSRAIGGLLGLVTILAWAVTYVHLAGLGIQSRQQAATPVLLLMLAITLALALCAWWLHHSRIRLVAKAWREPMPLNLEE